MITTRDKKYMSFVRRMAVNNPSKAKLAACLVYKNDVISIGQNSMKTHPTQKRFSKNDESIFKHAEVDCIINALKHLDENDLQRSTLYVYRVKKLSKYDDFWSDGMSHPCVGCQQAIEHFGIKRVVYSTDINNMFCEIV